MKKAGVEAAVKPFGRVLFLSRDPALVREQLAGRELDARAGRRAARRHLHRRDHAAAGAGALRRHAGPLCAHRLFRRRRTADRARRAAASRHRGAGGRQPLRQGQFARAQPAGRAVGGRAAGDRRELRAHLPPERRQPGAADQHRLRAWSSGCSAARRSRSTSCWPVASRRPRRSCAPAGCWPMAWGPTAAAPPPTPGPKTLFEKIVERHALKPGFVRADRRFIHEIYTGMCAQLLQQRFGPGYALHDPASIVCFEDHHAYVERSPVHVARGLVGNVRRLAEAHREFVATHGLVDHGLQTREAQRRRAGHLARADGRALRAAGRADRRHRLAHAAQRRAGLRRLRRRHHRHGQCLHDRRGALCHARGAAHRGRRPAAAGRERQGPGAAPAGAAGHPRRRRRRPRLRVRRRGGARDGHRRTRDADQHDGRTGRLHRHRRARRGDAALPARAARRGLRASSLDAQRCRCALRRA